MRRHSDHAGIKLHGLPGRAARFFMRGGLLAISLIPLAAPASLEEVRILNKAGAPELARQILKREVRVGRPLGLSRLPAEAKSASFAVPTGLLVYPQFAHLEHVETTSPRQLRTGTHGGGYFGKVGQWLREGF